MDLQVANPKEYQTHYGGRLDYFKQLSDLAKENIDKNKEALAELDTALPTKKEFYELTRSKLLDLLNEDDILVLDAICNEFVTNLRAGNNSTPVIKLNPPYDLMVDLSKVTTGRSKANNFEPYIISLLHILNKMWDTETYEKDTAPIVMATHEYASSNQIKGKLYAYQ